MQTLAIASSALIAQSAVVSVAAQNVANELTPGYGAKTASLVSMAPGVKVGAVVDTSAPVDLASEFVTMMLAETAYRSALKIVSTSEQMSRDLLAAV
jgi:flagellar hook protein FlgE